MKVDSRVPEHRLAEALFFDSLSAAKAVDAILRAPNSRAGLVVLDDIRREEGISPERLSAVCSRAPSCGGLRAAAQAYKVDTDAIALKVKHEFAAKEKARSAAKIELRPIPKASKKTA